MTEQPELLKDPYNLIITGVGGQGNVLASRMVGDMLARMGFFVTIGETFGASQRGGSVMSHLRVSTGSSLSPQIPKGCAHMVVALEPTEAIRVLKAYGNPEIKALCNTRPIHSIGVICGEQTYPPLEAMEDWIRELTSHSWFLDTTEAAVKLGNPILGNTVCVGALAATGELPLAREVFRAVVSEKMSEDKVALNLSAYDAGRSLIKN
jgi:indolepyruvate ferredoxin oxidoreductase, beta subunit